MYKIQQGNEDLNSNRGILLAGTLLKKLKSLKKLDRMRMQTSKKARTPHSGILTTAAGLPVLGRSEFADVEYFRQDRLFREALGVLQVPPE